ncbi:MAG: hypothetical protein Q7T03_05565 [Deltaproteobacteria bacterium]|nr:hypothetical protein [Deltaproteobacteria bacterium]
MAKEKQEDEWGDIELEAEPVCPNCGQFTEGEDVCPHCGAILTDGESELDGFHEEEEH